MSEDDLGLCCCEYFDSTNERNHILACCCNCVDLDASFDSLIRGQGLPDQSRTARLMATVQDRMRIPWRGGAKQLAFDAILPIILLPFTFILAATSLWWTIFAFTACTVIFLCIFTFFIRKLPRTKFFLVWTITSIVILYVIFELIVIPFLQINVEENLALSVLIGAFLLCFYLLKTRANQLAMNTKVRSGLGSLESGVTNCRICQIMVPDKDHHCSWFDCCIGRHNQCLFILALFFATSALFYSSNLTLTSVCHPFVFYKTILLPDDCSEVYQQFELGLSFVSALYSLALALILLLKLIFQLFFVSIGVNGREWRQLSFKAKLFCGLRSSRPHNRGFFGNWSRIICWTQNHSTVYH